MYAFAIFSILLVATSAEHCYKDVDVACNSNPSVTENQLLPNCNAKYGLIDDMLKQLQAYLTANIEVSFEYLLMSTHFGNYKVNREGFKKLYRKLSDKAWDDATDIIKFITTRGGEMNFKQPSRLGDIMSIDEDDMEKLNDPAVNKSRVFELNELQSLSKALDTQKDLMKLTQAIHSNVNRKMKTDASITHYLEEKFVHPLEEGIRTLAGYTNELKNLLKNGDASLSIFLFDEYLKNTL